MIAGGLGNIRRQHVEKAEIVPGAKIVVLSDVQGYGYEDIANVMGVAVGTVKSRISRGRSALRTLLKQDEANRELFERFVRISSEG